MVPAQIFWSRTAAGDSQTGLTGDALFSVIWETLADLFGTSTTAVVIRRAAKRGAVRGPELADLEVSIREVEHRYTYTVPSSWSEGGAGVTPPALKVLVAELLPLLSELTGRIAVRRLERIPALLQAGLITAEPKENGQ